jgi:tetratricopeptide (TPR) repeat protein
MQRQALELVAERFPEDPLFSIALLDFYIPEKRYDDAIASLERLQNYLGIDDALVNARLSAIYLAKDDVEQAHALAMKSITQDADVELGWWSLLRARTSAENYAEAIEALVKLEEDFGHSLGPDALSKDPTFRAFMLSDDYRKWFEGSD